MKFKNYLIGLIIFIILLSNLEVYSKENGTLLLNSKQNIGLEHGYLSFAYSNIFIPDNDRFENNFSSSGNNFFGLTFGPLIFISENYCISSDLGILFGNIEGNFALKVYFLPSINLWVGHLNIGFGSGISALNVKNENAKYGGLGSTSEAFVNAGITEKILIGLKIGYDSYSQSKYNTISLNLKYIIF
jgi:hypothetical protein